MYKQYIKNLYVWLFITFLMIVIFNLLIDPYALFNVIQVPHVNTEKPALISNIRAYKIYEINKLKPQALILGSSRAQVGLPSVHVGFKYPAYNVGLPLATIDEMWDFFTFAQTQNAVKQVVLAVDFFSFNAYLKTLSPFRHEDHSESKMDAFNTNDKVAALIGWSGLKGSLQTINYNIKNSQQQNQISAHSDLSAITIKTKTLFEKNEKFYLERKIYKPYPQKQYALYNEKTHYNPLDFFGQLLKTCKESNSDCHIIILPIHARQMALMDELGLWQEFENWKRALVKEIASVNPALPLYDFTGFTRIQTEKVPEIDDTIQKMKWFVDSAHITPALGEKILDMILTGKEFEKGFGAKLYADNIDSHLLNLRQQKCAFQETSPMVVQDIRGLISSYT